MPPTLAENLTVWTEATKVRLARASVVARAEECGRLVEMGDGIATVDGLPEAQLDELLMIGGALPALVMTLDKQIGCVLLGESRTVAAGERVRRTGEVARVPVGEALLGRVVSALGEPLDGLPPPRTERREPVERAAPGIVDRDLVTEPLYTGTSVVDAAIPLGRGQRQLIIGDRKTGKTALAVDAIINQRNSNVICVYAAIGQKASSVAAVVDAVRTHGALERCLFVVGEADAPPGVQWLAPYAACTMAEFFRDRGQHVLLVLDDLTKHAAIYRELSLLLRSAPGREAYPGDIFYTHSRLLERSARLSPELGGGSLSALAIAETQGGNLTAYIPTNLVSITDGQIYLEPQLFNSGQRPAVNVGKSVSRVGGKAQSPALKELSKSLRLEYAQLAELEVFTRFGAVVDDRTKRSIAHGRRLRAALTQPQFAPLRPGHQAALLLALHEGVLDSLPLDRVGPFREALRAALDQHALPVVERIDHGGRLTDEDRASLLSVARAAGQPLQSKAA